jgi:DNA-binding MarR family transcriptional regulator
MTVRSEVRPLSAEEQDLMRALAQVLVAVPRALDGDLVREQGLSANEYYMLMHLSEAPERRLRMGDLGAATAMTLGGVTRIVKKLEEQDLVVRERTVSDGRGQDAVLTEAGLTRLRNAWPTHLQSVRRHIFDKLAPRDSAVLTRALQHIASSD